MGTSEAFQVYRITEERRARWPARWAVCCMPGCSRPAEFVAEYEYTNRRARHVLTRRAVCPEHAATFGAKHRLAVDVDKHRPDGGGERKGVDRMM